MKLIGLILNVCLVASFCVVSLFVAGALIVTGWFVDIDGDLRG